MTKHIGRWGSSLAIRLDKECTEVNIKQGEKVDVRVNNGVIEIRKIDKSFSDNNGVKFVVKE